MVMLLLLLGCDGAGVKLTDGPVGHDSADTEPPDTDSAETIPGESGDTDTGTPTWQEPDPDVVVDCTGGGDFTTITAAIAATPSGSRIGLAPCTYAEPVDFRGKTLDIYGLGPRTEIVIDAPGGGPVVKAVRGESVGTRLAHVTLTGGGGTYGAGVYTYTSLLTLEDVRITGVGRTSALVYGEGMGLALVDVSIGDNDFARGGYLFYTDNGWLTAERLDAECDDAQYGVVHHQSMLLLDSRIDCPNTDVAMYVSGGELHARRSDIVGGTYGIYGEDNDDTRNERMWLYNTSVVADDTAVSVLYMHVKARNDVFHGGRTGFAMQYGHLESWFYASAFVGGRCPIAGDGYAYVNAWNALDRAPCYLEMPDAIVGDPLFVDAPDDFHLQDGSPLIDAGDPDEDENDDDDTRNDIGRYGGPEADGPR